MIALFALEIEFVIQIIERFRKINMSKNLRQNFKQKFMMQVDVTEMTRNDFGAQKLEHRNRLKRVL